MSEKESDSVHSGQTYRNRDFTRHMKRTVKDCENKKEYEKNKKNSDKCT